MHSLEVIIARNARAAGREAGHAVNDGRTSKKDARSHRLARDRDFTQRCDAADGAPGAEGPYPLAHDYFRDGYLQGRSEG